MNDADTTPDASNPLMDSIKAGTARIRIGGAWYDIKPAHCPHTHRVTMRRFLKIAEHTECADCGSEIDPAEHPTKGRDQAEAASCAPLEVINELRKAGIDDHTATQIAPGVAHLAEASEMSMSEAAQTGAAVVVYYGIGPTEWSALVHSIVSITTTHPVSASELCDDIRTLGSLPGALQIKPHDVIRTLAGLRLMPGTRTPTEAIRSMLTAAGGRS